MNKVRKTRKEKGMSQERLAEMSGVNRGRLSRIERQLSVPPLSIALKISKGLSTPAEELFDESPAFTETTLPQPLRYIDLFCGIGGFRYASKLAFDRLGLEGECVFSSDNDLFAQESYEANFGEKPLGDITKIDAKDVPDFDLLFGGFPCQAFSICGLRKGFEDKTKGTLFFDIARILKEKRPTAFVLENVKNLASHNGGDTFRTILSVLRDELGYCVDYKLLNALDFGLPQKRERVLIVGAKKRFEMDWNFDVREKKTLADVLEKNVDQRFYASPAVVAKRKARHKPEVSPAIWHENKSGNVSSYPYSCALRAGASHNYLLVDGERRLTPREMLRLQGFPDEFKIVVSDFQIRKQAGNAIPVDMVAAVIENFLRSAFLSPRRPSESLPPARPSALF
ncbi:MAG: DNA (cytosine-5-)-methyltransferase [Thermoguttaceae bacterium]|nr:DNA (cytosine-5-)-methyltransferase [Thermoguttaceae bacterium]